jgi:hypothetical protein
MFGGEFAYVVSRDISDRLRHAACHSSRVNAMGSFYRRAIYRQYKKKRADHLRHLLQGHAKPFRPERPLFLPFTDSVKAIIWDKLLTERTDK